MSTPTLTVIAIFDEDTPVGPCAWLDDVRILPAEGTASEITLGDAWRCEVVLAGAAAFIVRPIAVATSDPVGAYVDDAPVSIAELRARGIAGQDPTLGTRQSARARLTLSASTAPMRPPAVDKWAEHDRILGAIQGDLSGVKRLLNEMRSDLAQIRGTIRKERNQDLREIPKPFAKDRLNPTDEEIEKALLFRLYSRGAWNNVYLPLGNLKRGDNGNTSHTRFDAALKTLRSRGWIDLYPKQVDCWRLSTPHKEEIETFLRGA